MIRRRRCGRYCFNRLIVFSMALISTITSMTWSYNYFSNNYSEQMNNNQDIYAIDETDLRDAQIKITVGLRLLPKDFFNESQLECQYPKLPLDSSDIWHHLDPVTKARPECEKSNNWVYVDNGLSMRNKNRTIHIISFICLFRFQVLFVYHLKL